MSLSDIIDFLGDLGLSPGVVEDRRLKVRLLHRTPKGLDVLVTPIDESPKTPVEFAHYISFSNEPHFYPLINVTVREVSYEDGKRIELASKDRTIKLPYVADSFPIRIAYHTVRDQIEDCRKAARDVFTSELEVIQEDIDTGKFPLEDGKPHYSTIGGVLALRYNATFGELVEHTLKESIEEM